MSLEVVVKRVRVFSCVLLSTWTVLIVITGGTAWTSAPLWSQVMVEEGWLSTVQLKETAAGEVTICLAEMVVTLGRTGSRQGILYERAREMT